MSNNVYNADELVYTVLTDEQKKKKKLRSSYLKSFGLLITLLVISFLTFIIVFCYGKQLTPVNESSSNKCPRGYQYFEKTGACYKITVPAVSFEEAKRSCESDGTHLVSIHSEEESGFLTNEYREELIEFLRNNGTSQERTSFWTGLSLEDEVWQWSDGSEVDYENWKHGVPGNQSYAVVDTASVQDLWETVSEESMQGFICKKQVKFSKKRRALSSVQNSKPSQQKNATSAPSRCSPGFNYYVRTGFCYKVELTPLKFDEASQACFLKKAHLASIHSATENNILNTLYLNAYIEHVQKEDKFAEKTNTWIGLIHLAGDWRWTDGSPVDYTNWAVGEPSQMEKMPYFAEMITVKRDDWSPKGNEWSNGFGDWKRPYFCKKLPEKV